MPDAATFLNRKRAFTVMILGPEGSGKTAQACSFPGIYALTIDPNGLDVLDNPMFISRRKNLVWVEQLNVHPLDMIFTTARDSKNLASLFGNLAYCGEMAKAGKVQTLLLDGFSYLQALKWDHILQFEKVETRSGEVDTQKMFQVLNSWSRRLLLQDILPMAGRFSINVVLTMHIQRESKQTVEGISSETDSRGRPNAAYGASKRQVNVRSDLHAMLIGGIRQMIGGMPSAVLYLTNDLENGELMYRVLCQKQVAFDTEIEAKNRYGLAPRLKMLTKEGKAANLYAELVNSIAKVEAIKAAAPTAVVKPPVAAVPPPTTSAPTGQKVTNTEQKGDSNARTNTGSN